jgi:glycosyltransferase involved in cell wall biosynthesis
MQESKEKTISIITVVKNAESTIERTIQSVLNQNHSNIEYIIVNGYSTDKTNEILEKYKDKINLIINKKDGGIWEAMNIGLEKATGDIVGFLNADDYYYSGALKIVNHYFSSHQIDFLFGTVDKYKLMHGYKPWKSKWSFGFYTSHSVGFFIKTKKHKEVGNYDPKYLSADLDLFYKMVNNFNMRGIASKKTEVFGKFAKGGFSSKVNYIDHLIDLNQIRIANNQNTVLVHFIFLIKILKKPFKFIKGIQMKYF